MPVNSAVDLTKQTFAEYSEDRIPRLSAALAYYALFSLAPLLVIAVAVAGFVLGEKAASGELQKQLQSAVGPELAVTIQNLIGGASRGHGGIIATIIGIAILLVGATSLFAELQDALNTIWNVPSRSVGVWGLVRTRFLSFLMILGIAALLMASVVLSTILTGLSSVIGTGVGIGFINQLVSLVVFFLGFAMIFKYLPDAQIRWSDVWVGAAVTAILFAIGRYLIGLYLARGGVSSVYGAAGYLVALLVWIFYSAQILYIGAEFTHVYATRYGKGIQPERVPEAPPHPRQPAPSAFRGPARGYDVPTAASSPSAIRKFVPLAFGIALGHFLLPRQSKPKPRAKPRRRFALTRIFHPGWRTRADNLSQSAQ